MTSPLKNYILVLGTVDGEMTKGEPLMSILIRGTDDAEVTLAVLELLKPLVTEDTVVLRDDENLEDYFPQSGDGVH